MLTEVSPAPLQATACRVDSEVGELRRVLVHRPGPELLRLTPANKDAHLFDDIPWLEGAQREHDEFVGVLRGEGAEVVELTDLLERRLDSPEERARFVAGTLARVSLGRDLDAALHEWLADLRPRDLLATLLAGITPADVGGDVDSLVYKAAAPTDFLIPPLANQMYVRDAGAAVGGSHVPADLAKRLRQLESLHLAFAFGLTDELPGPATFEGGDVLVLSDGCVAVGIGERTNPAGVDRLARRLLGDGEVESVLAVVLPATRETMHLDTVLTMVDWDACTISAAFRDSLRAFRLLPGDDQELTVEPVDLLDALADALDVPAVRVVETGGDGHAAVREQWNDANNVLAVRPGTVVAYARNVESNRELRRAGVEVLEIPGSELSRGRGGPHCLSHPLWRGDRSNQRPEGGDAP